MSFDVMLTQQNKLDENVTLKLDTYEITTLCN